MSTGSENLRRSARIARARASDSEDNSTPVKSTPSRRRRHSTSSLDSETAQNNRTYKPKLEQELETIEEDLQKPKELFHEKDVSANQYCGFRTPNRRPSMVEKAKLSRTPMTPRNLSKLPELRVVIEKDEIESPESMSPKQKSKRGIPVRRRRIVSCSASSESESVSEESEFVPTNEDSSSDDNDMSENNENDEDGEKDGRKRGRAVQLRKIPTTPSARRDKSKKMIAYNDFHMKTDEYFETQSEKVLTSNHTLARLKNPRLNEKKMEELLGNESHVSKMHNQAICKVNDNCRTFFPWWSLLMEEGYNLLLHGVGSKRNLINDFHSEIPATHPTLVVNGFFPSLTVKDILDSIITELLGLECPTNPNEAYNLIEETLRQNSEDRFYLLIHNIDGATLRSNKSQDTISRLAALENVRVLASVDHINTPLFWDNVKRARYNFYWFDTATLLPYKAETAYESSLLVQRSGALALSSLHNVFQSLTTNAKAIYVMLVKHQLENGKTAHYPGMAFKDLYRSAREGFLVSSDLALRAHLTEFIDHKLVKTKRSVDGTEYLVISLDNGLLQHFLELQNES